MSNQLSLVDYHGTAPDQLCEPERSVVSSASVTSEILEDLEKIGAFERFKLFEDPSLTSFVELTRIKEEMIDSASEEIGKKFIRLLDAKETEQVKGFSSRADLDKIIAEFHVVSALYRLLLLKKNNFAGVPTSVVKLG